MAIRIASVEACLCAILFLGLATSGRAFEANTDISIDLSAGSCTAFEVDDLPHKFSYDVELVALLGICLPQNISISKLYIQDACIKKRDNELGLGSIQLPACAEAQDSSSATCQSVFKDGPADAKLTAANVTAGQNFDSGAVCANNQRAFVYISSDCPLPSRATINVKTRDYDGKLCVTVAGRTLSKTAIAIIVVAVLLVLIGFCSILMCCCCCCR